MNKRLIILPFIIFLVFGSFSIVTYAENTDSNKINELSEKVEQLSNENKELRTLLDNINKESIRKDDIIKSLEDKEGNLIATTDYTINRVNFWLSFVEKSLAIDSSYGYAYATKAEIFAEQGNKDNEFYEHIELAMQNNCPVWEYIEQDEVYEKYINDRKFNNLINKYKNK